MENSREMRIRLYEFLLAHYSFDELHELSFSLSIDWDDLGGSSKSAKVLAFINYIDRRGLISELVNQIRLERPGIQLPLVFADNPTAEPVLTEEPVYTPISLEVPSGTIILKEEPFEKPIPELVDVLAEAKLILVGDGNVGKTSLVNQLISGLYNPLEETTQGVAMRTWNINLPHPEIKEARMNIWDFGGQGNMHAAHQYFFSQRSVYLLVLNVREDGRLNQIEYWLRLITAYGGSSPIIIVSNKIDQFTARLDERKLIEKYASIFDFIRTSCKTGEGISDLRQSIARAVCTLEDIEVKIPPGLKLLKKRIEELTDPSIPSSCDTISLDEFEQLCSENNISSSESEIYLKRLNDWGVMLFFGGDPRLEINLILNPYWVTGGIYRVINNPELISAGGILQENQIRRVLPRDRYPHDKAIYILDIMRKFELCFPLDDSQTTYLIPELLPSQQPDLVDFDKNDALQLHFEYPIWLSTTLTRLIVRLSDYLVDKNYWRNGAVFQSMDLDNRALVVSDEFDRRLRIWIDGNPTTRRQFLNRIREELYAIHKNQKDMAVREFVLLPDGGEIPYGHLVELEKLGMKTYSTFIENKLVEINVTEVLDGIRAEKIPDPIELKDLIVEKLTLDELDDLCFQFKISLDDIKGEMTKDSKARNLVRYFLARSEIPRLMAVLRQRRKDITWE